VDLSRGYMAKKIDLILPERNVLLRIKDLPYVLAFFFHLISF
jgi:hypothetical protein